MATPQFKVGDAVLVSIGGTEREATVLEVDPDECWAGLDTSSYIVRLAKGGKRATVRWHSIWSR